ncbi:hypothetical protein KDA00_04425 [Candidatus Saccharibacteria bacterium]|nr:hypothetical protein [Candidatus Saccharibacteria bacterium]
MDNFKRLQNSVTITISIVFVVINLLTISFCWFVFTDKELATPLILGIIILMTVTISMIAAVKLSTYALKPLYFIWQAIIHVSPGNSGVAAPNLEDARLGKELITTLIMQVYQFASQQKDDDKDLDEHRKAVVQAANVVSHLPLPLFVFNSSQIVTNASDSAMEYCQTESSKLFGKPLYESVNLEFSSEHTLEKWLLDCQSNKVTDTAYWERVRLRLPEDKSIRQCDIAAYYNRDNPSGTEFIVTFFDRTAQYNQDDEAMSFVALAVHELRTPLTMLRGYIEVFQDELSDKLDDELKSFMSKMQASASQLTAFVNNILNVSRIESNQMSMELHEEDWVATLKNACEDADMRARAHGIEIEYHIPEKLPTVAVDRISMFEVINNLIENAIKYSPNSKKIVVSTRIDDQGMVETSVQDFGLGIPSNVLPYLFDKFYRNHRTKTEVGGTGLGLFLCKSIVDAHGGQIWAKSKEREGSTFAFTLKPYSKLADEQKNSNNTEVTRTAHGWIKNHSLYRR